MTASVITCAMCLALTQPDEFRSGAPLTEGRGLINALLLMYEEHNLKYAGFDGTVVTKTKDTIALKGVRGVAREFRVAPPLASKRLPLEWQVGGGHRLEDVEVGDKVGLSVVPTPNGPVGVAIGIYRRPGGIIPPAEDGHLPNKNRIHNRYNAQQFAEETFVPKVLPYLLIRFAR